MKQPIRAELNIIIHDPSNKPITDRFILGRNPRVVNGHVTVSGEFLHLTKPHTFYVDIREQFKILYQCILWHL